MMYFEPDQLQALRRQAHRLGVSVAELVRRLVRQHLEADAAPGRPSPETYRRLVALGASGLADVSERHDSYLGAAAQRDHLR